MENYEDLEFVIGFPKTLISILDQLQKDLNLSNRVELIQRALSLFLFLNQQRKNGTKFLLEDPNGMIRRYLPFPFWGMSYEEYVKKTTEEI